MKKMMSDLEKVYNIIGDMLSEHDSGGKKEEGKPKKMDKPMGEKNIDRLTAVVRGKKRKDPSEAR